jgi:tetratricopeptide (TPR) repeat protein
MPEKRSINAAVLAAFFLLLATGCASFDTRIPASWEPRIELSETSFHPQLDYHCGPAALSTVLQSSGASSSYTEVVEQVYVPGLKGSLQVELMAAARSYQRIPFRLEGNLQAVLAEVGFGRPVLILQNLGVPGLPTWHYAVVIGYDRNREEILMRSGDDRLQATAARRWMRQWDWGSRWAVVVLAPGQLPVDPQLPAVLRALTDFDDHAPAQARLMAWQAAALQWPDEPLVWMALGNARYELGAWEEAVKSFERALEIKPNSWSVRLNLAQALLELDQPCLGQKLVQMQGMTSDHPLAGIHHSLEDRLQVACKTHQTSSACGP